MMISPWTMETNSEETPVLICISAAPLRMAPKRKAVRSTATGLFLASRATAMPVAP